MNNKTQWEIFKHMLKSDTINITFITPDSNFEKKNDKVLNIF